MKYEVLESREVNSHAELISDQTINTTRYYATRKYPDNLRLVVYESFREERTYRFLTNNFKTKASRIANLYC